MKISKRDALMWMEFFASLPEDEALLPRQQEIAYAVFAQIEAAVDAENERLINQAVEHLKQGRATLVIAHRISTIRAADRIVMVENGRVAGEGTYAQLMEGCPEFRKLMGDEYAGTEN